MYPAISIRYPIGTRILWSEVLTGPGAFLTTHEDTISDSTVPHLPPDTPHPTRLLHLHQVVPSSKSITVKSACGLLTIFPVQSECESFKAGSRPEAKSTKGPYFRIPAPRFTDHMRSAVPKYVLLDLKRPLPTSSTILQTSTPSITSPEKTVETSSLSTPKPTPASELLSKAIPIIEGISLSDGVQMLPILPNAYTSAITTDSTQPKTIFAQSRVQSVVIAEDSVETVGPPILDGTSPTPPEPIKPIEFLKQINPFDSEMVGSTKKNEVESLSLVDSRIVSAPECTSKPTGDQKAANVDISNVNEESIIPPTVIQVHKILSLDDLFKDEHLAWGSEESTSKDDITIASNTEKHPPTKPTTTSPSETSSIVEDSHIAITAAELVPSESIHAALTKPQALPPHLRRPPVVLSSPLEAQYVPPHLRLPPHLLLERPARRAPVYQSEKLFPHKPNTATPVPSGDPLEIPDLATIESFSNKQSNHGGVTHSQTSQPLPPISSHSAHKLTNLVTRRESVLTESSEDCPIWLAESGARSDTSISSGNSMSSKQSDIKNHFPPKNHTPQNPPTKNTLQILPAMQTEEKKDPLTTTQTSGSTYFLKTEKGLIELPVIYTFCDDKQCLFIQNNTPVRIKYS